MPTDPNQIGSISDARIKIELAMTHHRCPFCESDHWLPQEPDRAFLVQEAILDSAGERVQPGSTPSESASDAMGVDSCGYTCRHSQRPPLLGRAHL